MEGDDGNKRRRSEDEEESDPFVQSKKTFRTPSKGKKTNEDKLDEILELLRDTKREVRDMQVDIKEMRKDQQNIRSELRRLKEENEMLRNNYEKVIEENEKLKKEASEIRNNVEWLEKEKRERNIVLTGLTIDTVNNEELKAGITKFMSEKLALSVQIKAARKVGEKACLIELPSIEEKEKIMQNKNKLKNFGNGVCYINHDLTRRERAIGKQIRERARTEKQMGKQVKMGVRKLVIDGEEWRWNKEKEALEKTKNR